MLPIPDLNTVEVAWLTIQGKGYQLHGFLLYTASDHFFPEFMDGDGLREIDMWTRHDCAIFIVHTPSQEWIEYTKVSHHIWWEIFKEHVGYEDLLNTIGPHLNGPVLEIDGERRTMQQLFAPRTNQFLHTHEIAKILRRFGLLETDHPCLILFKDLNDSYFWYSDMNDLLNVPERKLYQSLKQWFGSREFRRIVEEARNA